MCSFLVFNIKYDIGWCIADQWWWGRTHICDNVFKAFSNFFRKYLKCALFILNFFFGGIYHFYNYQFNIFCTRLNMDGGPLSALLMTHTKYSTNIYGIKLKNSTDFYLIFYLSGYFLKLIPHLVSIDFLNYFLDYDLVVLNFSIVLTVIYHISNYNSVYLQNIFKIII